MRYFRSRRMQRLVCLFGITAQTRVLDVGGEINIWLSLPIRPRITFLNLSAARVGSSEVDYVVGDGRLLPFEDKSFDLVFSNSVIEHLGDFASQQLFAKEAVRVGIRYCVQTPNRWFPIDPHLFTPLIHFLPQSWQRRLVRNFTTWGLVTRPTQEQCDELLQEVRLLGYREFKGLFPNAEIYRERFLGLTKSLVAIGCGDRSLSVQQETTGEGHQLQESPRFAGQSPAADRPNLRRRWVNE